MEGIMSLVSATEYAGYTVKEWNIVQFSKLSSILAEVAREYKAKNMSFATFSDALSNAGPTGMLDISESVLSALEPFTKHAPQIICISCNVKAEKLDEMPFTDGVVLILLILKSNMEHLGRFFVSLTGKTNSEPAMTTDSTLS